MELKDHELIKSIGKELKDKRDTLAKVKGLLWDSYDKLKEDKTKITMEDYTVAKRNYHKASEKIKELQNEINGMEQCRELVMDWLLKEDK